MIELTVNNKHLSLPADAQISIEKNSPIFNDQTGAFSYPFTAPKSGNENLLGNPGRLERANDIPTQSFKLADGGINVLRGEIDFDPVTNVIPMILQSGNTEFSKKIEGKKLTELNLGEETLWPYATSVSEVNAKIATWDARNYAANSPTVFAPAVINASQPTAITNSPLVNPRLGTSFELSIGFQDTGVGEYWGAAYFQFQFRVGWLLRQIYQAAGYFVIQNELETTDYKKVILFSKPFLLFGYGPENNLRMNMSGSFKYADAMPDFSVSDFVKSVKGLLGIAVDIDERKKQVSIYFKKQIFQASNLDTRKLVEVGTPEHGESGIMDGFALRYTDQDADFDTKDDYEISQTVESLPETFEIEGEVVRIQGIDRDYMAVKKEDAQEGDPDPLEWKRIGRLRGKVVGNGEDETTIEMKIPLQTVFSEIEGPKLELSMLTDLASGYFIPMNQLYISCFHGMYTFGQTEPAPYTCGERYSINKWFSVVQEEDVYLDTLPSLTPEALYDDIYSEFLNWHYQKREVTKYLKLSLAEVVTLQWRKRYVISGVPILLNKINFDLPYPGICKITGFKT